MYHILVADKLGNSALEHLSTAADVTVDYKPTIDYQELLASISQYDALIVRSGTQVTAEVLTAGDRLLVIGRAGVGVDNIDLNTATKRGVIVTNTPGANSIAAAELTIALMLAAARHLIPAHISVAGGEWRRNDFIGTQLHGKVLGIVGLNQTSQLVAARAHTFGMEILAYDDYVTEEIGRKAGVLLVELDELLAQADFVSLHVALTPETTQLINADTIGQMKDGAILINTSRGKLVDEAALARALQNGKLRAAAVDVYASEPPHPDHPLIGLPNVLHIPHLGANTIEAEHAVGNQIVSQVLAALRGQDFNYAVNMPFTFNGDYSSTRPYLDLAETLGRLLKGLAKSPITQIEIEVQGDVVGRSVRALAAALLKGLLPADGTERINYINAPLIAHERGIKTKQTVGINNLDYPNLIACKAEWDGGHHLVAGVLFGGIEPRIVQLDHYRLEARPEGVVLIMQNRDVPGVIGQVGTLLAAFEINIGEWRLGRDKPGGEALSFINLDTVPPAAVLNALQEIKAVTQVKIVHL